MYSYEGRLRAVQLYIKLGKRIGLTIRQLGYPTKNALKTWYREYEQRHDLPAGYERRPKFSKAQKEQAVEHYLEHGRCRVDDQVTGLSVFAGQRCMRRLLRSAEDRDVLRTGLALDDDRAIRCGLGCVHPLVQR